MRMTVRQAMCVRDEGRSLGAGLRRQAPNHLERLGSRAPVVSVKEKARRDRVRCGSERRTQVNHRRSVESVGTTSKPGSSRCSGISAGEIRLLPAWRPALRWRESDPGSNMEPGNLSPRCQGRSPSGSPTRARVPMRGTGADGLVVAWKCL
jgi:hypothetical protein